LVKWFVNNGANLITAAAALAALCVDIVTGGTTTAIDLAAVQAVAAGAKVVLTPSGKQKSVHAGVALIGLVQAPSKLWEMADAKRFPRRPCRRPTARGCAVFCKLQCADGVQHHRCLGGIELPKCHEETGSIRQGRLPIGLLTQFCTDKWQHRDGGKDVDGFFSVSIPIDKTFGDASVGRKIQEITLNSPVPASITQPPLQKL
jgi:hypothetical protein